MNAFDRWRNAKWKSKLESKLKSVTFEKTVSSSLYPRKAFQGHATHPPDRAATDYEAWPL